MCKGDLMFYIATEISIYHSIKQILALKHSVEVGKLALLSQMVCLLHRLIAILC